MKRTIAVFLAALLLLTGCSGKTEENAAETGDIAINNERLLKEFGESLNIFSRQNDAIMLSVEDGEAFKIYDIEMNSGEIRESKLNEMADKYIYYDTAGDGGFLVVEGEEYRSILKYRDKDGSEKTIADDIGFSDAVNISVSPKRSRIAYTALQEGSDDLGLYVYDIASSTNHKLTDIKTEELMDDFSYLVNWSPTDDYVIIMNKYIYDTKSGSLKGELNSAFSQWSPSGTKIAFVLEESLEDWPETSDYYTYPGKRVYIYDVAKGSNEEVFALTKDEYIFGGIAWSGNEGKLAFAGAKVADKNSPDWYMKLNYSSVYIIGLEDNKTKTMEIHADASDGTMIELGNLKFSREGGLLSYTVGNYENSVLYVANTDTLESKSFEAAEYLHWMDNENYGITAGKNSLYFCINNSIVKINEKLQDNVKYTSKSKLDDFYLSKDETAILLLEEQEGTYVARYIGK